MGDGSTSLRASPDGGGATMTIDEHLSTWCAARTGDEIIETLWEAGVPVAKVMQPHRVGDFRNSCIAASTKLVDHPVNPAAGTARFPCGSLPGPGRFHRTAAPLLGEHNHEVLSGLGLSEDEIAQISRSEGVIGNAPAGLAIRTTKTG